MRRMYVEGEGIFYYISVMNENYAQPALPAGSEAGIVSGGYKLRTGQDGGQAGGKAVSKAGGKGKARATLLGSGTILREVLAAADILEQKFGVPADIYSITSFNELRREALECERHNLLHPGAKPKVAYVQSLLGGITTPVVAATDYMRTVADQVRQWVGGPYVTLGTDGYGRSDARAPLRRHFEVDRNFIALAALKALADAGLLEASVVAGAVKTLGIDASKPSPLNT